MVATTLVDSCKNSKPKRKTWVRALYPCRLAGFAGDYNNHAFIDDFNKLA
jgi:hypothetical protein